MPTGGQFSSAVDRRYGTSTAPTVTCRIAFESVPPWSRLDTDGYRPLRLAAVLE